MRRNKFEIIKDILEIVRSYPSGIKFTPLLRKSNLSFDSFSLYYQEIIKKGFIIEIATKDGKRLKISERGLHFLEKYSLIINFLEEFGLD